MCADAAQLQEYRMVIEGLLVQCSSRAVVWFKRKKKVMMLVKLQNTFIRLGFFSTKNKSAYIVLLGLCQFSDEFWNVIVLWAPFYFKRKIQTLNANKVFGFEFYENQRIIAELLFAKCCKIYDLQT